MTDVLTEPESEVQEVSQPPAVPPVVEGRRLGHIEYKWVALGVVLLGTIMTILDSTIVNIATHALQTDFHLSSYSQVAWVVTGYLLAQGAVIPMTGWATDRWGTKKLYLTTIVLFTGASALCGLAQSIDQLVIFRVLQGIGGGMMMPIGMTIILRAVGPREMGRVMGFFGIPMLLAPAFGPILGAWFVQDFTWRLIFYVNVPIGILAFFAATTFLVDTPKEHKLRLDLAGLFTATPAVLAIMYAVDQSNTLGWGSALVVSLCVVSVVFFAAFVATQLKHRRLGGALALGTAIFGLGFGVTRGFQVGFVTTDALLMLGAAVLGFVTFALTFEEMNEPLLHLELFRDRTFTASMVLSFLIVTTMFGAMFLMPLFLLQVHGYDYIHTALLLLPQAAMAAIAMPLGGFLSDRLGPKPVVITGLVLLGLGSIMLAQLTPDTSVGFIVGAMALRGLAMGFAMMPSMAAALARVPKRYASRASSITNTLQRVGSSVGIAVLVTVLAGQFSVASAQATCNPPSAAIAQAHAASPQALCASVGNQVAAAVKNNTAPPQPPAQDAELSRFGASYANNILSNSFDRTFALLAILSFLAIIPASFLQRPTKTDDGAIAAEMAA